MTINDRIADAITRHGPDSPSGQAHTDRGAYLLAVADRVDHRRSARPDHPYQHAKYFRPTPYWIYLFRGGPDHPSMPSSRRPTIAHQQGALKLGWFSNRNPTAHHSHVVPSAGRCQQPLETRIGASQL